jgi:hypothetical protein
MHIRERLSSTLMLAAPRRPEPVNGQKEVSVTQTGTGNQEADAAITKASSPVPERSASSALSSLCDSPQNHHRFTRRQCAGRVF